MKHTEHARPVFNIRPGMTDKEVADKIGSHVIRQPANVTWCNICERFVKVNHDCTDGQEAPSC